MRGVASLVPGRGAAAALLLLLAACPRPEPPPCPEAEEVELLADDGAALHLHHHPADGPPVLLVHGISSNHRCWDLEPGRSLARYLAERGLDAWLLDLRGHGDALRAPRGRRRGPWSLEDYALHDLPSAIDYVLGRTGAERLAYVGHSMGGMVGAVYAAELGDGRLSALVAVGSPVDFRDPDPLLALSARSFAWGSILPLVHTPSLALALERVPGPLLRRAEVMLYNPDNMEPAAARRMMESVVSPLWPGEMREFAQILSTGRFAGPGGTPDYLAEMARITVPTLVVAGRADRVAPPDRVAPYAEAVSGPHRFVLAGREQGFQEDYGHLDLPLGDRAEQEIYPLIEAWLRAANP